MSERALRPVRRRRRRGWRVAAVLLGLAVVFAVGVALGEALDDGEPAGGTQSIVRTLNPSPLVPEAQRTVTVTVTTP